MYTFSMVGLHGEERQGIWKGNLKQENDIEAKSENLRNFKEFRKIREIQRELNGEKWNGREREENGMIT